jgi:hypothetical protein
LESLIEKYILNTEKSIEPILKGEDLLSKIWKVFNFLFNVILLEIQFLKDILNIIPKKEDNFIFSGGTSFKAIQFLEAFESAEINNNTFKATEEKFIDILLNNSFEDLVNYIENLNRKSSTRVLKRIHDFSNNQSKKKLVTFKNNIVFISKNYRNQYEEAGTTLKTLDEKINIKIDILWKFNTKKCVDATTLFTRSSAGDENVFIGSHSFLFASINVNTGKANWEFQAKDRIESSACLSKCGNYVIFGKC